MTKPPSFTNARGEHISDSIVLTTDEQNGLIWQAYISRRMPRDIFKHFRLIEAPGSEEWGNVVEHSALVGAAALTLATTLEREGIVLTPAVAETGGWLHDATKRLDIERRIRRQDEPGDETLAATMKEFGYSAAEIAATKNTGRVSDRFIEDPARRMAAIRAHSPEENIVGYVDARTRGPRFLPLVAAYHDSVQAKPGESAFFANHWLPYYQTVEAHLHNIAPGFDPAQLDQASIVATIR